MFILKTEAAVCMMAAPCSEQNREDAKQKEINLPVMSGRKRKEEE
jgi:hypothetical protein